MPEIAPSEILHPAVDAVAASVLFRKAPVLRELLLYLWQHRETGVTEYAIGVDVLGRKPDFDPKTDSAVRVHMSRLRARLKEYYETAGMEAAEKVTIPPGEYRIALQAGVAPAKRRDFLKAGAVAAAALLAADNIRLRWGTPKLAIDPLWEAMARPGESLPILVPAPLFFRWERQPFVVRDFRISRPEDLEQSPQLESLRKQFGSPEVSHLYTIAADALAAGAIARYLEARGVAAPIADTPAATINLLPSHNAVLVVGPGSSGNLSDLMSRLTFQFLRNQTGVNSGLIDRKTGTHYPVTAHSATRTTGHGLIARLPGKTPGTSVLILASVHTPALAGLLIEADEVARFRQFLTSAGAGREFEAIVRYELDGGKVMDARPVIARGLAR